MGEYPERGLLTVNPILSPRVRQCLEVSRRVCSYSATVQITPAGRLILSVLCGIIGSMQSPRGTGICCVLSTEHNPGVLIIACAHTAFANPGINNKEHVVKVQLYVVLILAVTPRYS